MAYETLANIWSTYKLPEVSAFLQDKPLTSLFKGLSGSYDAFLISSLYRAAQKPIIVFVENNKRAEVLANECRSLTTNQSVSLFPSRDTVPYTLKSPFGPTVESRLNILYLLLNGNRNIIIAPYTTLLQKIPPQRDLYNKIIHLRCNDELSIEDLSQWLIDIGFHRENTVSDIGMFSRRGGIVDVYPFLTEHPFRIDFWDNTIESIRLFDVFSQKSLEHCNNATIVPLKEFCFSNQQITDAEIAIKDYCTSSPQLTRGYLKLSHQWNIGEYEGLEWFLHWFNQPNVSILDYCPSDTIIVWDDLIPINHRLNEAKKNYQRHLDRAPMLYLPLLSSPEQLLNSDHYLKKKLSCFSTIFLDTVDPPKGTVIYSIASSEQTQLPRDLHALTENIQKKLQYGYRCIIVSPNQGYVERMQELLDELSSSIEFVIGFLSRGHIDHRNRIIFFTESRFMTQSIAKQTEKKRSQKAFLTGFDALTPYDYVVHEDHGIAKFLGIEHITAGNNIQDCMVLLYAEGTRIYVPVYDFYKVQKYIGKNSTVPNLSKIGTVFWEKLKAKTRESLKEMAKELIDLYAKRQFNEGIKFDHDTVWQKEFEEAFINDETPDQLSTIEEIKKDMESSKTMDRLICGDVGFGKTEVAMRAAFKAVMSGYQVAVLAPTTILAAQHLTTFSERMSDEMVIFI